MTPFSPATFPYDSEDKEAGCSAQMLEEQFNDFFDQYLTHTVSAEVNALDYPDLFTDGETLTDSTSNTSSHSRYNVPQDQCHRSLSKTAFLPQNYQSHPRREKLQPAVSGLELLLGIEGQVDRRPRGADPPHSAPATTTNLPLRRKPRFRTSKSTAQPAKSLHLLKDVPDTMTSPSYNYRYDSPQSQEWTHGLEQLSLQSEISHFSLSPSANVARHFQDGPATAFQTPRHMTLRDEFFQGEGIGDGSSRSHASIGPRERSPSDPFDPFQEQDGNLHLDSTIAPHQLLQSPSWGPSDPTNIEATYILSSNHNSYYGNGLASKSAPALPYQLNTEFSMESLGAPSDSAGLVIHDDLRNETVPNPQSALQPYPDPPSCPPTSDPQPSPSQSPPRRITSPCVPPMPSRPQHRRSKSAAPRRKSASTLRNPKSNGSMSMGFVNFTPQDSKRILTGVAPSGSSKTKARREQEANEKKRKLSAAVLRALEEAGGDTEGLRREGLLADG
ncbi:MAG: hypothetical protein Q9178_004463 [Gyalolechia marmorata]